MSDQGYFGLALVCQIKNRQKTHWQPFRWTRVMSSSS